MANLNPKFQAFECVRVAHAEPHRQQFQGAEGTVIWIDNGARANSWIYIVHLEMEHCWPSFLESSLITLHRSDDASKHLTDRAEFSFDVSVDNDNEFIEGTYRLPQEFWQVLICTKAKDDSIGFKYESSKWTKPAIYNGMPNPLTGNYVTGIEMTFPKSMSLNRDSVLAKLSELTGYEQWVEVRGPDSIVLR